MTVFLAECYLPGTVDGEVTAVLAAVQGAAAGMAASGVVHLCSIGVVADGVCLVLYDGASDDGVRDVMTAAGLPVDRVVEAVWASSAPP